MFIEITNPTNPLRIENFLRPYKRGEKEFTPEVARKILTMTNHKKNIYDMLQLIANQPNQADYKDVILSTFDHREQPADTLLLGKKLAVANGYEAELNNTLNYDYINDTEDGIVYASAFHQIAAVITTDEEPDISQYSENISLYCTSSRVSLFGTDLSKIKSLKFKEKSEVNLFACKNLPEDLDISICKWLDLSYTDLSSVQSLKFKEGAEVYLSKCENLPADLDVSMCKRVDLSQTDLSSVKSLKFRNNAEVILFGCKNLPADLDISIYKWLDLSYTDLSSVQSLKFKEGTEVYLSKCENLPAELDLSMCDKVNLHDSDLSSVKTLTFKNQQQQEDSKVNIPEDWQGKIIYADTVRTNQNTQEKKIENSDNKQRKNNVFLSLLHKITSRNR